MLPSSPVRLLFAPRQRWKPGPKGPSAELIAGIVEMKRRNPRFGCRRIAQQIAFLFGVEIDKDVVRRVLAKHCRPTSGSDGPSWITTLGSGPVPNVQSSNRGRNHAAAIPKQR